MASIRNASKNPTSIDSTIYTYADNRHGYEEDASSFYLSFWITMGIALLIGAAIIVAGVYKK